MKDGREVTIRPIRPEDEPLMAEFHRTLSDRTVYLRYFASLSLSTRIAHDRLLRICFGDYEREMVLVTEYRDAASGIAKIVAVGRLNKLGGYTNEAEVAVLVSDAYQSRGLGHELLRRVVQVARDEKAKPGCFRDAVGQPGHASHLEKAGFPLQSRLDSPSVRAVLDL